MAREIPLANISMELERRIRVRISKFEPGSPELNEALTRIGILVSSQAKINARNKGIVDTGRLINSLRYELYKDSSGHGVKVGSFGVPYAAMHEFGGTVSERQRRAMFASLRERGKLGPKNQRVSKNVVQGNHWRARPFLRPAVETSTSRIMEILRGVLGKK